ncbi:MAG: molecular chaperone HtpG [Clostridiales bacterium]|nr:molecular chaperone HtpG [Clostridiales bacterium]
MASSGNISIHAQNIMPIIKKWLYSDKDIFIRELVANGCDAVAKRKIADPDTEVEYRVTVEADEDKGELRFIDNGVGMTAEEVDKYINQVAFSGAEEFLKQYGDEKNPKGGIIGHFGLGFYSAFMVADKVTIDTLSYKEDASPVRWESSDGMQYEITEGERALPGTVITLHLSENERDFLQERTLREVLDKYCAFMATPIYLNKDEQPVNDTHPLWLKNPSECTEEEYKEFYTKVFHEYEAPLFWVHLNVDYPFNLKGILYFPKLRTDFGGVNEGQIKMFSGQVFVADNIKEVIPEFLTLLKGVIDCPDLPLNVSRSFLQNDGYVKKLSADITRKVADKLTGMFNTERETYQKYWDDINPFIKYGCMKDESFYDRMKDTLLYKLTDGTYMTLAEYLEANKEKAENKVFYTTDETLQAAAISLYTEQGIHVAVLNSLIDVNFISFMEYKNTDVKFSRVDAALDGLKADDSAETEALDEGKLVAMFRDALHDDKLDVSFATLKNETLPAMAIEDEQMRRFKDMSRIYGGSFAMPSQVKLALNRRCPVIAALSKREANEDTFEICRQIFDLAQMARQPLEAEAMGKFIERSNRLLALLVK